MSAADDSARASLIHQRRIQDLLTILMSLASDEAMAREYGEKLMVEVRYLRDASYHAGSRQGFELGRARKAETVHEENS